MFQKSICSRELLLAFFLTWLVTGASGQANFSFSCLIDGQSFSEIGTSTIENSAFKTASDIINIGLVSIDPKYKGALPPQIALCILPNATTTIKGNGGKYTAKYSLPGVLDNDYDAQLVTVNIISLTASRIKGTFSGKFDLPASEYSKPLK